MFACPAPSSCTLHSERVPCAGSWHDARRGARHPRHPTRRRQIVTTDARHFADAITPTVIVGGTVVTMNDERDVQAADVLIGADGAIAGLLPLGSPPPAGARV